MTAPELIRASTEMNVAVPVDHDEGLAGLGIDSGERSGDQHATVREGEKAFRAEIERKQRIERGVERTVRVEARDSVPDGSVDQRKISSDERFPSG